jgi:hypothetical protein
VIKNATLFDHWVLVAREVPDGRREVYRAIRLSMKHVMNSHETELEQVGV